MAQKQQTTKKTNQTTVAKNKSSYSAVIERMNSIMSNYANLPMDSIYSAFGRAAQSLANYAPLQRSRVLAINPLPEDVSKEQLGEFLRSPQNNEAALQRVSEGLRWTNYSYHKLISSYSNMLAFHNYAIPQYITADEIKSDGFKREYKLVNKLLTALDIKSFGHKAAEQALTQGKVFYTLRYAVDKAHNSVSYAFPQQLPSSYCTIIGLNNISKYTISFNLCYFLQLGTDYKQFGDLFLPYLEDFNDWYMTPENQRKISKHGEKFVYMTRNNERIEGERRMWQQNGRLFYYVSLPIDRVWTFEIDDSTAIVASPFSGLMQTFAQQADYEAAQLSLILNPLIKIFTGEIPYYKSNEAKEDDGYRLSIGGRALFEALWQQAMNASNTGGTTFFTAPVENIKAWDYGEAANSNDVSRSFLRYGMAKSGSQGIIPIDDRPTEEAVKASEKLEPRFAQGIYRTLENMLNYILNSELSLKFDWAVHIFGDIYSDAQIRADALKQIDKGDITAWAILCALDDISLLDKVVLGEVVKDSGLLDLLQPPQLAYTQSGKSAPKSDTGGSQKKDEIDKIETETKKKIEVTEE